jgi:hypothetical protein
MGNKLKALTVIMLGGLALASCDKNDGEYSTRTSFTASASRGDVDLREAAFYQSAKARGAVTMANDGTVATLTCLSGKVSFNTSNSLTCGNPSGCTVERIAVAYSTDASRVNQNTWLIEPDVLLQNSRIEFHGNNTVVDGGCATGIVCIPPKQVSYWS